MQPPGRARSFIEGSRRRDHLDAGRREGGQGMVRHVVAFRFAPGTTDEQRERVEQGLASLPARIEDIRRYAFGPDLGLAEGNFDFVVVGDFDDADAYQRYAAHEAHQALIRDVIRPVLAERVAVQYEIEG